MRRSAIVLAALVLAAALRGEHGRAADPLPYDVTIAPTGDAGLDQAALDSSTLIGLRESAPVGPFALIGQALGDRRRLETVLHSFGYYKGSVSMTVAGCPLDDAGLADALDALAEGSTVTVAVTLTPGPLFRLRYVLLRPDTPATGRAAMRLFPGDPVRAAEVLAAGGRIRTALLDDGYALARVGEPLATLVPAETALDVSFPVEAGPRADLGPITVAGVLSFPDWWQRGQTLSFNLQAVREDLDAYDRTAAIAGATLARKLSGELTVSGGLQFEQAYIIQNDVGCTYSLLRLPLGVQYDSTHDLFDPRQGVRGAVTLTPITSLGSGGPHDSVFVIAQAAAAAPFCRAR